MYQTEAEKENFDLTQRLISLQAEDKDLSEQAYAMAERQRTIFQNYILPLDLIEEQKKRFLAEEEEKNRLKELEKRLLSQEAIDELKDKYSYEELLEMYRIWNLAQV